MNSPTNLHHGVYRNFEDWDKAFFQCLGNCVGLHPTCFPGYPLTTNLYQLYIDGLAPQDAAMQVVDSCRSGKDHISFSDEAKGFAECYLKDFEQAILYRFIAATVALLNQERTRFTDGYALFGLTLEGLLKAALEGIFALHAANVEDWMGNNAETVEAYRVMLAKGFDLITNDERLNVGVVRLSDISGATKFNMLKMAKGISMSSPAEDLLLYAGSNESSADDVPVMCLLVSDIQDIARFSETKLELAKRRTLLMKAAHRQTHKQLLSLNDLVCRIELKVVHVLTGNPWFSADVWARTDVSNF